jgi:predicted membrane channel-forming protein YqfA (hemolysin III family)
MRVIAINLLLLTLPMVIYFAYAHFKHPERPVSEAPFVGLVIGGALLMFIGLIIMVAVEMEIPNYTPQTPALEQGAPPK